MKSNLVRTLHIGSISTFFYSNLHISACYANAANLTVAASTEELEYKCEIFQKEMNFIATRK